jgi:glycosyltransferase involved in cell wall biosynthesis
MQDMADYDVSVIITTRNEENNIEKCLKSINGQDYPGDRIEIIVIDNNSEDRTKELSLHYTDKVFNFGPERSAQRNMGVNKASGEYILYLDADMSLSNGLISECSKKCKDTDCIALYIPERIEGNSYWSKVRDFERSFYNGTAIDCVRFVRRDKFLEIGGFDENLTGPEDWDLDRRIRQMGKVDIIESPLYHLEGEFNLKKYLNKKTYYMQWFDIYAQKWGKNDPAIKKQLGFGYRYFGVFSENGKWKKILQHPILTAGMYALRAMTGLEYLINRFKADNGVFILSPFFAPNVGGVETHLEDLTDSLRKDKYTTYVLTYTPLTTRAYAPYFEKKDKLRIIRIPWIGFNLFHRLEPYPVLEFFYLTPCLFIATFIFLLLKGRHIRVIHAQGLNAAFIGKFLSRIFKKDLIISTHAIYGMRRNSLMAKITKWTLFSANKILALSEASKRELEHIGLNGKKIIVYRYWVNLAVFKPMDKTMAKKKTGWDSRFVVLFVGRFIEKKGIDILCELAKGVTEDILFAFIGEGPLTARIKQASVELSNVRYVGKIDNFNLPVYYNAADVLCIPSVYEEGYGRVILEALACGLPVIASNKGGIPEVVNENVGILCEPNVRDLKSAIVKFYGDAPFRKLMADNALFYSREKFSDANVKTILNAYGVNHG